MSMSRMSYLVQRGIPAVREEPGFWKDRETRFLPVWPAIKARLDQTMGEVLAAPGPGGYRTR